MVRRGRKPRVTLVSLAAELQHLDSRRQELVAQIRHAAERMISGEAPFPWRGRKAAALNANGEPRKKKVMSPEARARIGAAQRKRWAKLKRDHKAGK